MAVYELRGQNLRITSDNALIFDHSQRFHNSILVYEKQMVLKDEHKAAFSYREAIRPRRFGKLLKYLSRLEQYLNCYYINWSINSINILINSSKIIGFIQ